MLKVYVLTEDPASSLPLVNTILSAKEFSLTRMSYDVVDFILSANSPKRLDLIIVDKYIDESDISQLTGILLSKFKLVVYCKNELVLSLVHDNVIFLERPFTIKEVKSLAHTLLQTKDIDLEIKSNDDFKTTFFIRCEKNKIRRVNLDEVLMIEADQNYIKFHEEGENFTVGFTLNAIEQLLPSNRFMRVHRSFIVNIDKINIVETNQMLVGKDVRVPIGQSYRNKIMEFFGKNVIVASKVLQIFSFSLSLVPVA